MEIATGVPSSPVALLLLRRPCILHGLVSVGVGPVGVLVTVAGGGNVAVGPWVLLGVPAPGVPDGVPGPQQLRFATSLLLVHSVCWVLNSHDSTTALTLHSGASEQDA